MAMKNQNLNNALTVLLACLGALGGSILSNNFDKQSWRDETSYNDSKALVDKRIELIERIIAIYNKSYDGVLLEEEYSKLSIGVDSNKLISESEKYQLNEQIMENRFKVNDLRKEFSVTMSLNSIFFW